MGKAFELRSQDIILRDGDFSGKSFHSGLVGVCRSVYALFFFFFVKLMQVMIIKIIYYVPLYCKSEHKLSYLLVGTTFVCKVLNFIHL